MIPRKKAYIILSVLIVLAVVTSVTATRWAMESNKDRVVISAEQYGRLSDLVRLSDVIDSVVDNYYRPIERDELIVQSAHAIVSSIGDPYSSYFTNEEYESFAKDMNGELSGIGVLLGKTKEGAAIILRVYEDTPAEKAGLRQGDVFLSVDDTEVTYMELESIAALVQGEPGTKITVRVDRGGEEKKFTLKRANVIVKRVGSKMVNKSIGYIRLDVFTGECVKDFKEALAALKKEKMKALVVDVRNNPGGSLTDVCEIVDMLMSEGVIVSMYEQGSVERVYRSEPDSAAVPIAVLVNANSASASEILAAALQDNSAATIIGEKTFGKGIVQTIMPLPNSSGWIKLTTSEYYTPSGRCIHELGVEPDITEPLAEQSASIPIPNLTFEQDNQLQKAVEFLSAQF